MRSSYLDRSQRFGIEPGVAMTETEAIDGANVPVDDGEFKLTIERRRINASPSRSVEKPGQSCRKFFHGVQFFANRLIEPFSADPSGCALILLKHGEIRISTGAYGVLPRGPT
jgi:hypothetical protein